jgi:hypothetical protein
MCLFPATSLASSTRHIWHKYDEAQHRELQLTILAKIMPRLRKPNDLISYTSNKNYAINALETWPMPNIQTFSIETSESEQGNVSNKTNQIYEIACSESFER